MQPSSRVVLACFLAILFGAEPAAMSAATPQPIHWTLSVSPRTAGPLKKGSTAVAHLHATIDSGWHLYGLVQKPGGPTAARISLSAGQPFVLDGEVTQPVPEIAIDPNFNLETRFYENQVTFTVPIKSTAPLQKSSMKVSVDAFYQTCNDTMCLPPEVVHVSASIKGR